MGLTVETTKQKRAPGAGRPRGAKDKRPRTKKGSVAERYKRQCTNLEKQVEQLKGELELAKRDYGDNPLHLLKLPNAETVTEQELQTMKLNGEIPVSGTEDELMALQARRTTVAKLILRGIPRATIAQHLEIPEQTLFNDIRVVRRQWRETVNGYDISEAVGESLDFYREVRNLALQEASNPNNKVSDIVAAASAALKAEDSKNNFLQRMGLYDVLDQERRHAFTANTSRELDQDSEEFSNVLGFMNAAVVKGGDSIEEIIEEAEYSDIAPLDPE